MMKTKQWMKKIGIAVVVFIVYTGTFSSAVADRNAIKTKGTVNEQDESPLILKDVRVEEKDVARSASAHFVLDVMRAEVVQEEGESEPGLSGGPLLPKVLSLSQNYPNPFNPTTTIVVEVPGNAGEKEHVKLIVYDIRGRKVRTLVDSDCEPGSHRVVWDGKNDRGQRVTSGVYLYTLSSDTKIYTRKMVMIE